MDSRARRAMRPPMPSFVFHATTGPLRVEAATRQAALWALHRLMVYGCVPGVLPVLDAVREESDG